MKLMSVSDWWIRVLRAERVVVRSGLEGRGFSMLGLEFWGRKVNEWWLRDGGGRFMASVETVSRLSERYRLG